MTSLKKIFRESKLNKLYSTFVDIGIHSKLDEIEQLRVKMFNTIVLLFVLVLGIDFIVNSLNGEPDAFFPLICLLFTLPVLWLNHKQFYFYARIYLLTVTPIFVLFEFFFYGHWVQSSYMLLVFIFGIITAYDNIIVKTINILYLLVLTFIAIYFQLNFIPLYSDFHSTIEGVLNLMAISIGIVWCWNFFFKEIVKKHEELRVKNKELQTINQQLESAIHQNDLKTELLGIIAHDVRSSSASFNNLTHKVSYLIETDSKDRLVTLGKSIEVEGMNLYYNIDNLLNWVASIKDKIEPSNTHFFPNGIINSIIQIFSPLVLKKELDIINRIDNKQSFFTDEHIFRVIFQNILHNAIKYSDNNGHIPIEGYEKEGYYQIAIKNLGEAIDIDLVKLIRDGKKPNTVSKDGYGLGLGISFSLVELLGGAIEFEIAENETTAIIKIPIISS